jgi:hypothetical protein
MGKGSRPSAGVPRRHRMRKAQRRESARAWIDSGATVTVKSYVKRYGTDRYTACEDLKAIGFPLTEADERWAVRPVPVARPKKRADPPWDWRFDGYQVMLIIGHTPGGFSYGPTETAEDHLTNCMLGPEFCPWEKIPDC